VSSEKRIAANRRNGRVGKGPRSVAGKAKASRNALRHGLSLPVLADPPASVEASALAICIMGGVVDPALQALALRIAEAQIGLCRVQQVRRRLLDRKVAAGPGDGDQGATESPARLAHVVEQYGKELSALDRYERRALSQRKFAIRALDAARLRACEAGGTGLAGRREYFGRTNPSAVEEGGNYFGRTNPSAISDARSSESLPLDRWVACRAVAAISRRRRA